MKLSDLPKIVKKTKRRLGRGHGSGRGKTAGRGTKGQKARGTIPLGFEGGQLPLIKRLPLLRGKGKNRRYLEKNFPLALEKLAKLPANTKVTLEFLKKQGLVDKNVTRVKILNGEKLTVSLIVELPCSASARKAIEDAGGKVIYE